MSPAKKLPVENLKTDVVVIGAGGSGLPAAVAAAEKGLKVIQVEKRPDTGGNSTVSGACFACDSPVQKRMGVDAPADHFFKMAMEWHHWKTNPRLLRNYINHTGPTMGWLESQGMEFTRLTPQQGFNHIPVSHWPAKGPAGGTIMPTLAKKCGELGVKMLLSTPAKKILRDAGGKVTGVIAESKDKQYNISAKAVIICTGGYPANPELLKKYSKDFSDKSIYVGIPEVVGDGLNMANEAGAANEGLGYIHYMGLHYKGSPTIGRMQWMAEPVWVNKFGERYAAEDIVFDMGTRANALERQPDRISYTILDEAIVNKIVDDNKWQTIAKEGSKLAWYWTDLPNDLKKDAGTGTVKISDSWGEIAKWMGVPAKTLKATIDEYNAACEAGYDFWFLKDRRYLLPLRNPPFYAIKCFSDYAATMGCIKVNHNMQVLDKDDKAIPGLYCAGMDAGGWESESYCFYLFGGILSFAVTTGHMAGENVVEYLKGNKK